MRSWHEQKNFAIWWPATEIWYGEVSIVFELREKTVNETGPCLIISYCPPMNIHSLLHVQILIRPKWYPNPIYRFMSKFSRMKNVRSHRGKYWKDSNNSRFVLVTRNKSRNRESITRETPHIEGILPKGPYLPCVSIAGRVLLAGYPRYIIFL